MLLSEVRAFIVSNRTHGRGEAFGFDGKMLDTYLTWAFSHDYLFLDADRSGVAGVGVVYPMADEFNGHIKTLYTFANPVAPDREHQHELCIMDVAVKDKPSLNRLLVKFKKRYPSWSKVRKWALRDGKPVEITNKYLNLIEAL